jgi:uncharacterized protein DUF3558
MGLLLAGCTTSQVGTPTAGDRPTATSTTTATPDHRPRDIDMAGADVCRLVTALPLATFGLDRSRAPVGGDSALFPGSRDCFVNGTAANLALTLVAVADVGVAEFLDGANVDVDRTEVRGYPLYVLTPPTPESCFGALDVADGQLLYVNYGLGSPGAEPATPQATLCERVPGIAAAALDAL